MFTATKLQAGWRGYSQKSKYQKLRTSGRKKKNYIFTGIIVQRIQIAIVFVSYDLYNVPCSYCYPGVVEGDPGQEEGQAQARGCWHYPQVPTNDTIHTK